MSREVGNIWIGMRADDMDSRLTRAIQLIVPLVNFTLSLLVWAPQQIVSLMLLNQKRLLGDNMMLGESGQSH